jgi:predicted DNA-binding transcriptional regulator AlpA
MHEFKRKYLDPMEVETEYGLATETLKSWRYQSRGPRYHKVGRRIKYKREDIEAYLDSHKVLTRDDH